MQNTESGLSEFSAMLGISNWNMCLPTQQRAEDLIFCKKKIMELSDTRTDSYKFCDNEIGYMSSQNLIYILI
jgi:hypothetical protein